MLLRMRARRNEPAVGGESRLDCAPWRHADLSEKQHANKPSQFFEDNLGAVVGSRCRSRNRSETGELRGRPLAHLVRRCEAVAAGGGADRQRSQTEKLHG